MSTIPTFRSVYGEGKPRLILTRDTNQWTSIYGTTYTATTVTEAMASTVAINSSTAATSKVTFGSAHGLSQGDRVLIASHTDTTPSLNAEWTVSQIDSSTEIRIAAVWTGNGSSGTGRKVPNFERVAAGMRVAVAKSRAGQPTLAVYGRITAVDRTNKIITVDQWVGGTPETNDVFAVNGFVVDLPLTQKMQQRFAPIQIVHDLYRNNRASKFFGYEYSCTLDYSVYLSADDLFTLNRVLNVQEDDQLTIVPHVDKIGYEYNVLLDSEIPIGLFGLAGGHRDFVLVFKGKQPYSFPTGASGYGFGYALTYGTGL